MRVVVALALLLGLAGLGWWFWPGGSRPDRDAVFEPAEVDVLAAQLEILRDDLRVQADRIALLELKLRALEGGIALDDVAPPESTFGGYEELLLLGDRRQINAGMTSISIRTLTDTFGIPAPSIDDQCGEPESERLLRALEVRDLGPFRVRMVRPALDSLERILVAVEADYPDLFEQVRTYGAFCVRLIRGSAESISRHAFGIAIDLSIGGTLDRMGDGKTQFGLIVLSEYFREEGWIWGAGFAREDSMHFEVSEELFRSWLAEGAL